MRCQPRPLSRAHASQRKQGEADAPHSHFGCQPQGHARLREQGHPNVRVVLLGLARQPAAAAGADEDGHGARDGHDGGKAEGLEQHAQVQRGTCSQLIKKQRKGGKRDLVDG